MKIIKTITGFVIALFIIACNSIANSSTETFKVYGNCGMCKKTIEKSLDKEGIEADWNKKTKMIKVTYDSKMYTSIEVHELIAGAGYDTELARGDDSAYNNLHVCCKYERRKD